MKVLLHGYYDFGNLGDQALLWTILRAFSSFTYEKPNFLIPSHLGLTLPEDVAGSVRFVSPYFRDLISTARSADITIFGGGSQFQDHGSLRFLKYVLRQCLLAAAPKRVCGLGIGIGPLTTLPGRIMTSLAVRRMDPLLVRDAESLDFAQRVGVRGEGSLDIVLAGYLRSPSSRTVRVPGRIGVSLLGVGQWLRRDDTFDQDWTTAFGRALGRVRVSANDISYVGVAFQTGADEAVLRSASFASGQSWGSIDTTRGPDRALADLESCSYIIAMRFHALVFAYLLGIPMIAINYHPKVGQLASALGYPRSAVMEMKELVDERAVEERILDLVANPHHYTPSVPVDEVRQSVRSALESALMRCWELVK